MLLHDEEDQLCCIANVRGVCTPSTMVPGGPHWEEKVLSVIVGEENKEQMHRNLPHYDGVISSILEQHLNRYIAVERAKAEEIVMSARNETFGVLAEDGSLTET